MADSTAIVGVIGILTSGVFGPMVAGHLAKDRENRLDLRSTIDSALDASGRAYVECEQSYYAINGGGGNYTELSDRIFIANSAVVGWSFKLGARIGIDHPVRAEYQRIVIALKTMEQYAAQHAHFQEIKRPMPDESGLKLEEARDGAEDEYKEARRAFMRKAYNLFGDAGMTDI